MKLLFIGDVVGQGGCELLRTRLHAIKREYGVDMVIANGENSAAGNGILPQSAEHLFKSGVDVITTGNHAFKRREMAELYDNSDCILRPANFGEFCVGKGICIMDFGAYTVAVVNLMGVVYMESLDNPFTTVDKLLDGLRTPNIVVDFHAEATGEKRAMGFYLAGRVSALLGTHTHVQTADEGILEGHTGYITDVGMTGPDDTVLGVRADLAIAKMKTHYPVRFENGDNPCTMHAMVLQIDEKSGKCESIVRIQAK